MRYLIKFFVFSLPLFAFAYEYSTGCVNMLTGIVETSWCDLTIHAQEPIEIRRTYNASRINKPFGSWDFVPHEHLVIVDKKKSSTAFASEPNGMLLTYRSVNTDSFVVDFSASNREIASRAHPSLSTLKSQKLVRENRDSVIIHAQDGSERRYAWVFSDKERSHYIIKEERLLNGNHRFFSHDSLYRLTEIKTTSPSQKITFAWCRFNYAKDNSQVEVHTSDSRKVIYHFQPIKALATLTSVECPDQFVETIEARSIDGIALPLFQGACRSDYQPYRVVYYTTEETSGHVKALLAPTGENGAWITTHEFFYAPHRTEVVDAARNRTIVHFSDSSYPIRVELFNRENQLVHLTTMKWTEEGLLTEQRESDGRGVLISLALYHYDQEGNLIDEKKNGAHIQRTFGQSHLLLREQASGATTEWTYKAGTHLPIAKAVFQGSALVLRETYAYDGENLLVSIAREDGSSHAERRIQRTAQGMPEKIEDYRDGALVRSFALTFSHAGHLLKEQMFDSSGLFIRGEECAYNASGQPILAINALGEPHQRSYNSIGQCIYEEKAGCETFYTYDLAGRLMAIDKRGQHGEQARWTFAYNALNQLIATSDPLGLMHEATPQKRPSEEQPLSYDSLGRVQSALLNGITRHYSYDLLDRMTQIVEQGAAGDLVSETTFAYDAAGNLSRRGRRIDSTTWSLEERHFDALSRPIKLIDTLGKITDITYEIEGNLLKISEWKPDGSRIIVWQDSRSLPHAREVHTGNRVVRTDFSYDEQGRCIDQVTDGVAMHYQYDQQGNLASLTSSDGTIHYSLEHNASGALIRATDQNSGKGFERTYDSSNRLIKETLANGLVIEKEYDEQGRPIQVTLPDHSGIGYRFEGAYLKEVNRLSPSGTLLYKHTFSDHDLLGFPRHQRLIEGLGDITYTRDAAGNVLSMRTPFEVPTPHPTTQPLIKERIERDALGRITLKESAGTTSRRTYDYLNRLVSEEIDEEIDGERQTRTYAFFYDETHEIGAVNAEGKIEQAKVRAPIPVNAGDGSVVFELGGRTYLPFFDTQGNVSYLVSLMRRYVIESYLYTPNEQIFDEWGDRLHTSAVHNPWRKAGQR